MILLLILTSVLLLVSGVIKLRAAERAGVGVHVFSLVELLGGAALGVAVVAGSLSPEQGMGAVLGAVAVILVSSIHLGRRLGHKRRLRDLTEGRRLENYVKLQASIPGESGGGEMDGISRGRRG